MKHELLLLRHGKSDWDTGAGDFDRPLKDRGKRGAQRIAVWLQARDRVPDHVVSSPALRALETARKASKAMGLRGADVHEDPRIYLADTAQLLEVLGDCPQEVKRILLVGHNPGLEQLVEWLSDAAVDIPQDGKLLPTATLAWMTLETPWDVLAPGCASLEQIIRAKELPRKFPFPSPHGSELRDRPAYYYTQSSVIPYRVTGDEPEYLVIASSKAKHWVVPKGIQDPGQSAQASAAKEAREEAGAEGDVDDDCLGSYRYEKWGADCTVSVYPMRVSRLVPESQWEERHRGREWVSVDEAARRLKQRQLVPMLRELDRRLR